MSKFGIGDKILFEVGHEHAKGIGLIKSIEFDKTRGYSYGVIHNGEYYIKWEPEIELFVDDITPFKGIVKPEDQTTNQIFIESVMGKLDEEECFKLDDNKPRIDLINPRFLEDIGKGLGFGAEKYSDYNYRDGEGLDRSRLYGSLMRHALKYAQGEKIDEESGISHLTAIAINANMLYTLEEENKGKEYNAWIKKES